MSGKLKVVMAQLNLLVGDIDGNTDKLIASCQDAIDMRADLIAFPELSLTSYPPEDLLLRPSLRLRVDKALERILDANLAIYCVVGYPQIEGESLYNALAVIRGGEILATYYKQCLPNYQVFDERRYFSPGSSPCLLKINGIEVAFTICEDLWEPEPVAQAAAAGAALLININASPFHIGKQDQRRELLRLRSEEGQFPIVYTNLVGGQDELVFDGGSLVVDSKSQRVFEASLFEESLVAVELGVSGDGSVVLESQSELKETTQEEQIYNTLVMGVRDYVNKNKFKDVVLGLSGGIDSALTLAIAVDALGNERVEAVMMPFEYTSQLSLDCAAQQAEILGVDYRIIAINEIYDSFMRALEGEFKGLPVDVSEQNIQARARGVILMGISNKKGSLVLTTGNKSEIAVGYSTLYGDMAGGFDVLKDVSKTMVYKLSKYRNQKPDYSRPVIPVEVIERPPSAELAPDQKDQDSLPPYDVLDQILECYVERDMSALAIEAEGFDKQDVQRVLRLVDLNEYKRRQSPIGVRLTQKGFGRDRRYPITNGWPIGE